MLLLKYAKSIKNLGVKIEKILELDRRVPFSLCVRESPPPPLKVKNIFLNPNEWALTYAHSLSLTPHATSAIHGSVMLLAGH
jgi:hypothetical protein